MEQVPQQPRRTERSGVGYKQHGYDTYLKSNTICIRIVTILCVVRRTTQKISVV